MVGAVGATTAALAAIKTGDAPMRFGSFCQSAPKIHWLPTAGKASMMKGNMHLLIGPRASAAKT